MKKLQKIILVTIAIFGIALTPLVPMSGNVSAIDPREQACKGAGGAWDPGDPNADPPVPGSCSSGTTGTNDLPTTIKNVVNILLFVIGVAAVIMIVLGGLRYVLSGGDQAGITGAKNTIIYAVIGLVVAILAYAIVNFVLQSI